MANSSAVEFHETFGAVGYIIEGSVIGIGNLLVGLSILKYSALRNLNEYVLLMALAFADAINTIGYFAAGVYRLWLIVSGRIHTPVSPLFCLGVPHVIMWMLGLPASALMLSIISADRLFLVAFPEFYLLSLPSPLYAYLFVGFGLVSIIVMNIIALIAIFSLPEDIPVHAFCYVPRFLNYPGVLFNEMYEYYIEVIGPLTAFSSVIIFAAALPIYKFRWSSTSAVARHEDMKQQKRMTKSLAISTVCTLCLYSIPYNCAFRAWDAEFKILARVFFLVSITNPAANLGIYQLRHPEMKLALKGLLTRKSMSANLKLWQPTATVHRSGAKVGPGSNRQDMEIHSA